jgi:hypothetical protein
MLQELIWRNRCFWYNLIHWFDKVEPVIEAPSEAGVDYHPSIATHEARCTTCKQTFTLATGYPARAAHGPDRCTGQVWEPVS